MKKICLILALLIMAIIYENGMALDEAGIQVGIFTPKGYYYDYFENGNAVWFNAVFKKALFQNIDLAPEIGFIFSKFKTDSNFNYKLIPLGMNFQYGMEIADGLEILPQAGLGGYLFKIDPGNTFFNPYFKAGAVIEYQLIPELKVSLGGHYLYFYDPEAAIKGWNFLGGVKYCFGDKSSSGSLMITEVNIPDVFASAYHSYYKKNAGKIQIKNNGELPLQNLSVSIYIPGFMESPSVSRYKPAMLKSKQSLTMPVNLYFSKKFEALDSDTTGLATIEVTYEVEGKKYKVIKNQRIKLYSRNSINWEDLNHAGGFISLQDSAVAHFARQAIAIAGNSSSLPENVQNIIKVVESLKYYQINYVKEPKNNYQSFLGQDPKVDLLQYPRETLVSKTGACADITVLLAALLENISVPTALVASETHVFLMAEVKGISSPYLISYLGKTWLPLETTEINNGFSTAWQKGFENYQNSKVKKIKTIIESITEYPPINVDKPAEIFFNPKALELEQNYKKELEKAVKWMK